MSAQDIFDALVARMETISGLAVKFGPLAIEESVKPVVAVVPEQETAEQTSKSTTDQKLNIQLRLIAESAENIEPWSQAIMAAMLPDPTLGGAARQCELTLRDWTFFDPVFPQNGVKHHYTVTY